MTRTTKESVVWVHRILLLSFSGWLKVQLFKICSTSANNKKNYMENTSFIIWPYPSHSTLFKIKTLNVFSLFFFCFLALKLKYCIILHSKEIKVGELRAVGSSLQKTPSHWYPAMMNVKIVCWSAQVFACVSTESIYRKMSKPNNQTSSFSSSGKSSLSQGCMMKRSPSKCVKYFSNMGISG